jgi:acylphosphatase
MFHMKKLAEIIISGQVQKAGFRDFIDELAFDLNLKGYVKNLDDGTVKVTCEGEEDLIRELLIKVNITQYPIRVEHIDVVYSEPTGEYKTFEVIREDDLTLATYERMDAAVRYMRQMNSNLGNKIDGLGDKIDQNRTEIQEMNSNLGDKIDQNRMEISSEIRLSRDDFRSHLDERISILERELAQIKAKIML